MLSLLKEKNPRLSFFTLNDVHSLYKKLDIDFSDMLLLSEKLPLQEANVYIPDDYEATSLKSFKSTERNVFAELPIQSGWCYGGNIYMNGMEWHKSSEVVVACTVCVLLLGSYNDINNNTYDSAKAVALYLKKGEAVELMPMTLHLAPLPLEKYFKVGIILPKGTNMPLESGINGDRRAVNKWLLVHKDNQKGIELGGKLGIVGDNIYLNL